MSTFIWTDYELQALITFKEKWASDPSTAREAIAERIYKSFYKTRKPKSAQEKDELWKAVTSWTHINNPNRQKPPERKEEDRGQKQWNWRTVIYEENRDIVQDLIDKNFPHLKKPTDSKEDSGDAERRNNRFKKLQPVLTEVIQGLTPGQVLAAKEKAKKWNAQGPPPAVRERLVQTKLGSTLQGFAKHLRVQFGVAAVFATAHKDEAGNIMTGVHEWNRKYFGVSFIDTCPKKSTGPINALIDKFGEELFDDGKIQEREKTLELLTGLPTDVDGRPRVPEPPEGGWTHKQMKIIIRLLYKGLYKWAGVGFKSAPPWAEMGVNPTLFFENEFILPGFTFMDPSHIKVKPAWKLLKFIIDRQNNPNIPVAMQFKAYQKNGENGKEMAVARNGKPVVGAGTGGSGEKSKRNQAKPEDIWSNISNEEEEDQGGVTEEEANSKDLEEESSEEEEPIKPTKGSNKGQKRTVDNTEQAPSKRKRKLVSKGEMVKENKNGKGQTKSVRIQDPLPTAEELPEESTSERAVSPVETSEEWLARLDRMRAQNPVEKPGKDKETARKVLPRPKQKTKETKSEENEDNLFMRKPSIRPGPSQNSSGYALPPPIVSDAESEEGKRPAIAKKSKSNKSMATTSATTKKANSKPHSKATPTIPSKRKISEANEQVELEEPQPVKRSTSGRNIKTPKQSDGTQASFPKPRSRGA